MIATDRVLLGKSDRLAIVRCDGGVEEGGTMLRKDEVREDLVACLLPSTTGIDLPARASYRATF